MKKLNYRKQQKARINNLKKEVGKMLIDMAKLVFGGVILAGIMRQDLKPVALFIGGGCAAAFLAFAGLYFLFLSEKNK